MTKSEFELEAGKAGISPYLYGAVIAGRLYSKYDGYVYGGKVVGIVWVDDWQTEQRYSPMYGSHEEKYLGKSPLVVLKKGRFTYRVDAYLVSGYVHDRFVEWLKAKIAAKESL